MLFISKMPSLNRFQWRLVIFLFSLFLSTASATNHSIVSQTSTLCPDGYTGMQCNACSAGYYLQNHECHKCHTGVAPFVMSIFGVLFVFALFFLLARVWHRIHYLASCVFLLQDIAICANLRVPWSRVANVSFRVVSFFVFDWRLAQLECTFQKVEWFQVVAVSLLMPAIFLGLHVIYIGTLLVVKKMAKRCCLRFSVNMKDLMKKSCVSFFCYLNVAYMPLCAVTYSTFSCAKNDSANSSSDSFLWIQPSVDCSSDSYKQYFWIGFVGLAVYVVGIPLLYFVLWISSRASKSADSWKTTKNDNMMQSVLAMVFSDYKENRYWWQAIIFVKRQCLPLFIFLLTTWPSLQTALTLTYLIIYICLLLCGLPFISSHKNIGELIHIGILSALIIWSLASYEQFLSGSLLFPSTAEAVGWLIVAVLAFVGAVLLIDVALFTFKYRKSAQKPCSYLPSSNPNTPISPRSNKMTSPGRLVVDVERRSPIGSPSNSGPSLSPLLFQ